ncbi:NAD-dependent epimerase/dehydratase family protein [Dehalococcoidia bacterium]|nr:NAD-dependent epimerase/dehydratase family protein [Dehalococcoidia bacterium]
MAFRKSRVLKEDYDYVWENIENKGNIEGSVFLITGIAGFLGFNFANSLCYLAENGIKPRIIIGLDNFILGNPPWIEKLAKEFPFFRFFDYNIAKDELGSIPNVEKADYIVHLASIASPSFYRKYPIETIDANVWGLRKLLDFYRDKKIRSFLFFSSSEIYGDPPVEFIPTPEDYRGNVSSIGPRACYDEAKRLGETLCYFFNKVYSMPIKVVRPFNNYGPGLSVTDKRVVADFASSIKNNEDIVIHSDGSPTRTFCYVSDAISGYFKCLMYDRFDVFNIGIDRPEISIRSLATIYKDAGNELLDYRGSIILEPSKDRDYLAHNPRRRCPDISKARRLLKYDPKVQVYEGVKRYLRYLGEANL